MPAVTRKRESASKSAATSKKSKMVRAETDPKPKAKSTKQSADTKAAPKVQNNKSVKVSSDEKKQDKKRKAEPEVEIEVLRPEKKRPKKEKKEPLPKVKAAKVIVDKVVEETSSDDWSEDEEEIMKDGIGGGEEDASENEDEGKNYKNVHKNARSKNGTDAPSTSKSREAHATQKKLAAERKAARPNASLVQQSKHIWEQVRRHSLPITERKKLLNDLCELIKGHVKDLVFKHDASRILQTILKNGTAEQREMITKELKSKYVALAQSTYGRYLLVKMMFYGDASTKSSIIKEFFGHIRPLIKHKEASIVVEDAWQFATPAEKERMIREFYGVEFAIFRNEDEKHPKGSLQSILEKSPEKRPIIMKSLLSLLQTLVTKDTIAYSITHRALLEYITNAAHGTSEITEFLELVKDNLTDLAFTKHGSEVVQRCLGWGTPKDRKGILKSLKPILVRLAEHENGHKILLSMFDFVDDTKLTAKTFISEIEPVILTVAKNNWGKVSLLYPVVGRSTFLLHQSALKKLEDLDDILRVTSKKDYKLKFQELAANLIPFYLKYITENARDLVEDPYGAKFVLQVILSAGSIPKEEGILKTTLEKIRNEGALKASLEAIADTAKGDPQDAGHIINSRGAGKMFKALVAGGIWDPQQKVVQVIDPPLNFASILIDRIAPDIGQWAIGKGIYVVFAFLESHQLTTQQRDDLYSDLKNNLKTIRAISKQTKDVNHVKLYDMVKSWD